jgi:hypothetical protein
LPTAIDAPIADIDALIAGTVRALAALPTMSA